MKKIVTLLLTILYLSCSSNNETDSDVNSSFKTLNYYTINDGIREDYSLEKTGFIIFTDKTVTFDFDSKSVLNVTKIVDKTYSVWREVEIDEDNGTPIYTVIENLTIEISNNEIIMRDDDHPITHGSYYEIHFILL